MGLVAGGVFLGGMLLTFGLGWAVRGWHEAGQMRCNGLEADIASLRTALTDMTSRCNQQARWLAEAEAAARDNPAKTVPQPDGRGKAVPSRVKSA